MEDFFAQVELKGIFLLFLLTVHPCYEFVILIVPKKVKSPNLKKNSAFDIVVIGLWGLKRWLHLQLEGWYPINDREEDLS